MSSLSFLLHLPVTRSEEAKARSAMPMLLSDLDLPRTRLTLLCPECFFVSVCVFCFVFNCHLRATFELLPIVHLKRPQRSKQSIQGEVPIVDCKMFEDLRMKELL